MSSVNIMKVRFLGVTSFNRENYKGDVSSVTNRDRDRDTILQDAKSFKQTLCGDDWTHAKATEIDMLEGSYASISWTGCAVRIAI